MTTNTAAVIPPARQDPRQLVNTLKKTVNFNDVGIAAGVPFDNSLPMGAFIMQVLCEIVTAFNAGTTNVLTVGGGAGPTYNSIIAAADVDETAVAVTSVTRALGRGLAAAGDLEIFGQYVQTGNAATTGQAVIVIAFEGGWPS